MFKVLKNDVNNSFTTKKSKFLTFGFFVNSKDEIKNILTRIRKEYSDASHICYGYILDDNTYYYSDDGEPSGCAGQPIYNVIKTSGINYCLFIVVRYFGGIKFGPGPLRQTFRNVTLDTLKSVTLSNAYVGDIIKLSIPYDKSKKIINSFNNLIIDKEYRTDDVVLSLAGSKEELVSKIMGLDMKIISVLEKQIIKK